MRSTTDASPPPSVMPLKYRRKSLSDDDRGEVAPQLSTRQSAATPFTYSSSSCSSSPIATSAVLTNSSSGSPTGFAHTRDGDSPDDPYRDFAHLPRSSQSARFNSSRSKAVDAWLHDKDAVRYTGGQPGVYAYRATPSHYSYYNPVPSSPSDFDPTYSDAIDSYVQTSRQSYHQPHQFPLKSSITYPPSSDFSAQSEAEEDDDDLVLFSTPRRRVSFSTSAERDVPYVKPKPIPAPDFTASSIRRPSTSSTSAIEDSDDDGMLPPSSPPQDSSPLVTSSSLPPSSPLSLRSRPSSSYERESPLSLSPSPIRRKIPSPSLSAQAEASSSVPSPSEIRNVSLRRSHDSESPSIIASTSESMSPPSSQSTALPTPSLTSDASTIPSPTSEIGESSVSPLFSRAAVAVKTPSPPCTPPPQVLSGGRQRISISALLSPEPSTSSSSVSSTAQIPVSGRCSESPSPASSKTNDSVGSEVHEARKEQSLESVSVSPILPNEDTDVKMDIDADISVDHDVDVETDSVTPTAANSDVHHTIARSSPVLDTVRQFSAESHSRHVSPRSEIQHPIASPSQLPAASQPTIPSSLPPAQVSPSCSPPRSSHSRLASPAPALATLPHTPISKHVRGASLLASSSPITSLSSPMSSLLSSLSDLGSDSEDDKTAHHSGSEGDMSEDEIVPMKRKSVSGKRSGVGAGAGTKRRRLSQNDEGEERKDEEKEVKVRKKPGPKPKPKDTSGDAKKKAKAKTLEKENEDENVLKKRAVSRSRHDSDSEHEREHEAKVRKPRGRRKKTVIESDDGEEDRDRSVSRARTISRKRSTKLDSEPDSDSQDRPQTPEPKPKRKPGRPRKKPPPSDSSLGTSSTPSSPRKLPPGFRFDEDTHELHLPWKLPIQLDELEGMLIECFATSRASSITPSTLWTLVAERKPGLKDTVCPLILPTSSTKNSDSSSSDPSVKTEGDPDENDSVTLGRKEWLWVIECLLERGRMRCGMFGKIESSFKDEHTEKPALEAQWFYDPERDSDKDRATVIRSLMPRPGKRSVTKQYKQYYWKPLGKISKWDPEDEL